MKKLLIFVLLITPLIATAKRPDVKKFEFEIGLTHNFAAAKYGNLNIDYYFGYYFEGRFNFKKIPLDIGFNVNFFALKQSGFEYIDSNQYLFSHINIDNVSFVLISDYAFRRGMKINPYVGIGIGGAASNKVEFDTEISTYGKM